MQGHTADAFSVLNDLRGAPAQVQGEYAAKYHITKNKRSSLMPYGAFDQSIILGKFLHVQVVFVYFIGYRGSWVSLPEGV